MKRFSILVLMCIATTAFSQFKYQRDDTYKPSFLEFISPITKEYIPAHLQFDTASNGREYIYWVNGRHTKEGAGGFTVALIVFNALNYVDVFVSRDAIRSYHASEFNSIMRGAVGNPPWDFIVKTLALAILNPLLKMIYSNDEVAGWVTVSVLNAFYAGVIWHNAQYYSHYPH